MPWTKQDFPDAMKHLQEAIRNKAIDVANALVDDGYEEGRAIAIGISEARAWAKDHATSGSVTHHLVPHDDKWAIKKSDSDRPSFLFETKQDGMDKVKELAKIKDYKIMIHDQDGQFQKLY